MESLRFIFRFIRNGEEEPDYEPRENKERVEPVVDEDISEFNRFFQGLGNEPLNNFEKSVIKTYLAWKLGITGKEEDGAAQSD